MDSFNNSKIDQQVIYEIYRACRLCGAGAGYKMPIIQNVVDLDSNGIELKEKIRDCVQIEVTSDDKMPPLICELCVDKVNDFYEFVEMCQRTNRRTRLRLGLPLQSSKVRNEQYDSNDCILGVTEQVYKSYDSDEPLSSRRPKTEPKVKIKLEKPESKDSRARPVSSKVSGKRRPPPAPGRAARASADTRAKSRSPSPRVTRQQRPGPAVKTNQKKPTEKLTSPPPPKSILKKESKEKIEEVNRSKRCRDPPKPEVPTKKVKLAVPAGAECTVCGKRHSTAQALGNHMRTHTVTFTPAKLSCDACGLWFASAEAAASHHSRHARYACRRCRLRADTHQAFRDHITNNKCLPWMETPDEQCPSCWRLFATRPLLRAHRCKGPDARPGGKCVHCKRSYALLKNQKKHEESCSAKRKSEPIIDPSVRASLRPAAVLVIRCDDLLKGSPPYDVSFVPEGFGVVPGYTYPYTGLRSDRMVRLPPGLGLRWDDSDTDSNATVDSLVSLSLKTISKRMHGEPPRKKRIRAAKNAFDMNADDIDKDMKRSIDNIIDNLDHDDDSLPFDRKHDADNDSVKSESLLCNDADDFTKNNDSIFNDSDSLSLFSGAEVSKENDQNSSKCSFDKLRLDKDSASTDCETEDDLNEIVDRNESRLSNDETNCKNGSGTKDSEDKNIYFDNSNTDLVKNNESNKNNVEAISTSNISDVNNDKFSNAVNIDGNDAHIEKDRQLNGDEDEISEKNEDSDKKLNVNHDQISEVIDNYAAGSDVNTEKESNETIKDKLNSDISIDEKKWSDHEQFAQNNDEDADNNDKVTESNDATYKTADNDLNVNEDGEEIRRNHEKENEEMCDEIENTINTLIASKQQSEDSELDKEKSLLEDTETILNSHKENTNDDITENNDDVSENNQINSQSINQINDSIPENNYISDSHTENTGSYVNSSVSGANVSENNDNTADNDEMITDINDVENNEVSGNNESHNNSNESEKEKISLEDLLPPKVAGVKSMDLDSISDEEFDFDAIS